MSFISLCESIRFCFFFLCLVLIIGRWCVGKCELFINKGVKCEILFVISDNGFI